MKLSSDAERLVNILVYHELSMLLGIGAEFENQQI